jgi:uncharacterized alkaline shock family protein YloU
MHNTEEFPMVDSSTPSPTVIGTSNGVGAGKTTIDTGVIAKVAGIATTSVAGVHAVGGGVSRALGAIRGAINQADLGQGVSVEVGERQVAVDITLVAEYPMPLQKVADDVRASVYAAIEGIVGMDVAEVNVTINDVYIPGQEDDDETTKVARVQ